MSIILEHESRTHLVDHSSNMYFQTAIHPQVKQNEKEKHPKGKRTIQ